MAMQRTGSRTPFQRKKKVQKSKIVLATRKAGLKHLQVTQAVFFFLFQ